MLAGVQGEGKGTGGPNPQAPLFILIESNNMHPSLCFHLGRGFECHISVMPRANCLVLPFMKQPLTRREVEKRLKKLGEG